MDPKLRLILTELIHEAPVAEVIDVTIGLHWTAVTVERQGNLQAGLASTIHTEKDGKEPTEILAEGLQLPRSSRELVQWVFRRPSPFTSAGVATLNALLQPVESTLLEANAEEILVEVGAGKKVAVVGRFPFAERLRQVVDELWVFEKQPTKAEYHEEQAPALLPMADVVAITAMSLVNHTLGQLLAHCDNEAFTIVLGPSTPLAPLLFDFGVDILSGSIVEQIHPVVQAVRDGAGFHYIRKQGVRLVNLARPGLVVEIGH